jgi:hypothetical protein
MNNLVERDERSVSGWRLRMSIQKAMRAYRTAFEILPSVHRGYERGAFEGLRVLLLLAQQTVQGFGAADSALYQARLGLINDTLVLVPYPWRVIAEGKPNAIPPGFQEAQQQRRMEFRRIAAAWSAAFPSSSGAKQAVALSLEMLGDPGAIDTMRLARRLALERTRRLQLAADEVLLLVKFGIPDHPEFLRSAQMLGDSVLSARDFTSDQARTLIATAALLGRCRQTEALSRNASLPAGELITPARLYVEAQVHLVDIILSCPVESPALTLSRLADLIAREQTLRRGDAASHLDAYLLYRPALLSRDTAILRRLSQSTRTRLVSAALYAALNDTAQARRMLDSSDIVARDARLTPDIGFIKARLSVALSDTSRAIRILDRTLTVDLVHLDQPTLDEAGVTASISAAVALRADLADATRDSAARQRWGMLAASLLGAADPPLQPATQRMQRYARMH